MIHPLDAEPQGIVDGDWVKLKNQRGEVYLRAQLFDGVRRGVLIAESIWPNAAHPYGRGINTLTGADQVAPYGGAAFHDNRVALEKAAPEPSAVPLATAKRERTEPVVG
jgi:anaerobic selenocysteine-containing dehydrogenase